MRVIESINSPGKGIGTGDDRFGFDESGGRAWVIDGSTDVGGRRVMRSQESDAAWLADTLSRAFSENPPLVDEPGQAYLERMIKVIADTASREAREDLSQTPRYALPTGAGVWLRETGENHVEVLSLGDCICLIETDTGPQLVGYMEKPEQEAEGARKLLQLSDTERLAALQAQRSAHNTASGYWCFGLQPEAASQALYKTFNVPKGGQAVLMSDGLFRLVSPYKTYTPERLLQQAKQIGLSALLNELRGLEQTADDNARVGRLKTSDDACAILLEFD